jgi:hypothetical protein
MKRNTRPKGLSTEQILYMLMLFLAALAIQLAQLQGSRSYIANEFGTATPTIAEDCKGGQGEPDNGCQDG